MFFTHKKSIELNSILRSRLKRLTIIYYFYTIVLTMLNFKYCKYKILFLLKLKFLKNKNATSPKDSKPDFKKFYTFSFQFKYNYNLNNIACLLIGKIIIHG